MVLDAACTTVETTVESQLSMTISAGISERGRVVSPVGLVIYPTGYLDDELASARMLVTVQPGTVRTVIGIGVCPGSEADLTRVVKS